MIQNGNTSFLYVFVSTGMMYRYKRVTPGRFVVVCPGGNYEEIVNKTKYMSEDGKFYSSAVDSSANIAIIAGAFSSTNRLMQFVISSSV